MGLAVHNWFQQPSKNGWSYSQSHSHSHLRCLLSGSKPAARTSPGRPLPLVLPKKLIRWRWGNQSKHNSTVSVKPWLNTGEIHSLAQGFLLEMVTQHDLHGADYLLGHWRTIQARLVEQARVLYGVLWANPLPQERVHMHWTMMLHVFHCALETSILES